jgi:trimeric autotransporter adhesin
MKKIYVLLLTLFSTFVLNAQTVLINPTGDGGFETGTTFAANNWTVVNSSTDGWVLGTTPVSTTIPTPGPSAGTNGAYISSTTAASPPTWTYSQISTIQHAYYTITIPASDTKGTLSFKWKVGGEGTTTSDWDNLKVFLIPSSVYTPVANIGVPATNQLSGPGAVSGMYKLSSTAYNAETINVPVIGGTTYKLIFSWKSDGSTIANPPAAIDEVSFTTTNTPLGNISSTALGGLWSSTATWVGGVVPTNFDNVTIADGANVVIDQAPTVQDLTIGGGTSGILQWNATANALTVLGNVLVNPGANINMFTAVAAPVGTTINVRGNFNNRGTVHAAYLTQLLNFNNPAASSTLSGAGTYVGGIMNQLFFQTTGSNTIASNVQPLKVRGLALTSGSLNTNGVISIDAAAQFYGQPINQKVYEIVVTGMGVGYTSAPTVTLSAPTGTGVTATATANFDATTGTVRSITITNPGDGYRANPTVTLTGGGFTTAATAVAVVNIVSQGNTVGTYQRSGVATISGGLPIKSEQKVGAIYTTAGGVGYTSAPAVGAALPFGYQNLVTSGGSGYTAAPTVTVSGGTSLTGVTNPTFTVTVAQGKVVSVIAATGGTLWTSLPTLTLTGGGGTGATAAYPAGSLVTANALISNGMVSDFVVTNGGEGYTAAPTIGLVGGGFTTAATAPTSRVGLYNATIGFFTPATTTPLFTASDMIPANGRINVLTVSNAGGVNMPTNLDLYASTPLTLTSGKVDMGSNILFATHPTYAGTTGSTTASVSGGIILSSPGGSVTRTFPYDASLVVATGTGSLVTGSTITSLTANRTAAPTGASSVGNATGTRGYRVQTTVGAVYGTTPTVTLNYNANDALSATLNASEIFVGQAASNAGPWTNRSVAAAIGTLAATGSRTTGTVSPTLIVPTGDDYFAWVSNPPLCIIPSSVVSTLLSATSGSVSWTGAAGAYIVEYGVPGFTPGTGATAGGGTIITSATSPVTITGLTPNTSYDIYVRQDCTGSSNGFSANSAKVTLYTGYCLASATAVTSWISAFSTTGGITNITHTAAAGTAGGYVDLTATSVSNYLGQSTSFSITSGGPTVGNAIWIDWNNNLTFETTERVYVSTGYGTTVTGSFPIPAAQANGSYRMRVITDFNNSAPSNPCGLIARGEYKDFTFIVTNAPTCTAPSALVNSITSPTSLSHSWTAASPAPTVGYEWAVTTSATPPASGTATTSLTDNSTGLTTNSTYYLHVRSNCGSGLFSTWVTSPAITLSYCLPTYVSGGGTDNITQVTLGTLADVPPANTTPYYFNRTSVQNAIPNLTQGDVSSLSLTFGTDGTQYNGVWVDFNKNLLLETSEFFTSNSNAGVSGTVSVTITIPSGALLGNTIMRVRGGEDGQVLNTQACGASTSGYGMALDYNVNIVAPVPCSGAPANVIATPASTSACGSTVSATLTVSTSNGGVGLTYQWQSSPAGANTFTDIPSATTFSYAATATSNTDYRCVLTCSGNSTNSNIATLTLLPVPTNDDVCSATALIADAATVCANTTCATSVGDPTFDQSSPNNTLWYSFTPTTTGAYTVAMSAPSGVTTGLLNGWLGIYTATAPCPTPAFTQVNIGTPQQFNLTLNPTVNLVTSALTAGTTYYFMIDGFSGAFGQFCMQIQSPPPTPPNCATALIPAAAATSVSIIPNLALSWTAPTGGAAPTSYDVYISATTPIPPATVPFNVTSTSLSLNGVAASTTYYWYVVPKNAAGPATGCNVEQSFTTSAQCNPSTTNGGTSGDALTDFVLNGETATAISVIGASAIATPGYINLTATTTVNMAAGKAYSGNFKTQDANDYLSIWIDFNNNGGFEANEMILSNLKPLGANTSTPYSLFIPASATPGSYKMRVRNVYYGTAPTAASLPCANYTYGEGKDFTVVIAAAGSGAAYTVSTLGGGACADIARTTIDANSNNNNLDVPLLDANGALIASLKANTNDLGAVSASIYRNTGAVRTDGIGQKYMDRNITITPATQPVTPVNVRLYYSAAELAAFQAVVPSATPATLTVTKTAQTCATTFAGAPNFLANQGNGSQGSDYYIDVVTPGFSTFFNKDLLGALPVTIEYINGTKQSNGNVIDWKISCTSIPEVTIELQRSSDSRNFRGIYTENATSVRCLQAFVYNDATPAAGTNYYRLKLTEPNGAVRYSSIIALINKDKGYEIVSLAPNPARANATLTVASAKAGKIDIVITDVVGKVISKQQNTIISGNNTIAMNFAQLAAGTYNVVITNADGEVKTTRFVKY